MCSSEVNRAVGTKAGREVVVKGMYSSKEELNTNKPRVMTRHKAVRGRHQNRVRPWPKEGLGRGLK
jgi:hypothetical protein